MSWHLATIFRSLPVVGLEASSSSASQRPSWSPKPNLLGYYRLLLGYSQKEFYQKGKLGRFEPLEAKAPAAVLCSSCLLLSAVVRSQFCVPAGGWSGETVSSGSAASGGSGITSSQERGPQPRQTAEKGGRRRRVRGR